MSIKNSLSVNFSLTNTLNHVIITLNEAKREVNIMSDEQIKELELTLFDFVKRAAGEKATAEEVEALPAVAAVLAGLIS